MAELWDPLETVKDHSSDLLLAARKREMQNILKSYVGFFDPFAELIQNAMDAVDARERELKEPGYEKRLKVAIDLQKNIISVGDNGIGFKQDQFKTFLCPNISFKDGQTTRGKKGVGATYLAYGFNHLQLSTKIPDYAISAEIKEGRKWLDDNKGIVTRPKVTEAHPTGLMDGSDRGSSFTLVLGGPNTRPKDLRWIGATTAEQWRYVLLTKTPLGQIHLGSVAPKPILFDLTVTDQDGHTTSLKDQRAEYIFPHSVISASPRLQEIRDEQQRRLAKMQDPSKLPDKFKQLNGIYEIWTADQLAGLFSGSAELNDRELVERFEVEAYGYFCYSVKVWDQFNDDVAKLRKGKRLLLRGGLQLATDSMPQGDLITIPLTSNIGYQNQAHVIVHFKNADPDLGRKGFQPELKEVAENVSVAVVNTLKKWRHLLKKDSGAAPSIRDEGELDKWIQAQREHEEKSPLIIKNPHFFAPLHEVSITSRPRSEQDVIVLFNQLIAGGVIRGLKLMATSSHIQYDGVYRFNIQEPLENHVFNRLTNPLGVHDLHHSSAYLSKPYVLEYKFSVDALIQEFESQEKKEKDIDLVVAWEMGNEWKKRYTVTSLIDVDNLQHRPFHGVTHVFNDENSGDRRFYGIILSELIECLDDFEQSQKSQKAKYAD
jgi:hypothetical protein